MNELKEKKYYYSLDILKFICAMIIAFHHYQISMQLEFAHFNFYGGVIDFSYIVEVFFIISGFLSIANGLDVIKVEYKNYIIKKIKRLYPIAILSIIACLLIDGFNIVIFRHPITSDGLGIWKLFNNFLMIFAGSVTFNVGHGFNNSLWYVCVLMLCYTVFYFINWYCQRKQLSSTYFFLAIIGIGYWSLNNKVALPYFNRLSIRGYIAFSLGIILYKVYEYIKESNKEKIMFIFSLSCMIMTLLLGFINYIEFIDSVYEVYVFIFFPAMIYVCLYLNKFIDKSKNICKAIGAISFELFVWHQVLINILDTIKRFIPTINYLNLMAMLIYIVIAIIIAIFMYYFVEKKINKALSNK